MINPERTIRTTERTAYLRETLAYFLGANISRNLSDSQTEGTFERYLALETIRDRLRCVGHDETGVAKLAILALSRVNNWAPRDTWNRIRFNTAGDWQHVNPFWSAIDSAVRG